MTKTSLIARAAFASAATALIAAPLLAAPRLTPEQQLERMLEGRVAGKPVDCINPRVNTETRVIDKTAIVYGSGRTIYVQRPDGASSLDSDDVLVTELRGTSMLCQIDVVRLHDRTGFWSRGWVGLNQFVPYTKVAARD